MAGVDIDWKMITMQNHAGGTLSQVKLCDANFDDVQGRPKIVSASRQICVTTLGSSLWLAMARHVSITKKSGTKRLLNGFNEAKSQSRHDDNKSGMARLLTLIAFYTPSLLMMMSSKAILQLNNSLINCWNSRLHHVIMHEC